MSNKATVEIGGNVVQLESAVQKGKAALQSMAATAAQESAKAQLAVENAVRTSKLKTQAAELKNKGDTSGAAGIEREIALQQELSTIRKGAGTAEQKKELELQAIRRKELADEQAILQVEKQRRAELDAINAIARKSAMERQKMLNAGPVPMQGAGTGGQPNIRGGGRGYAIGGVAMQLQDVAVQAQMGTNISTIVAQQGSQMLSAFGPTGMIVGGVVALGGALVTLGVQSQKAFEELVEGANDSQAALGAVIASGSISSIVSELEKSGEKMKGLKNASAELDTLWGGFKARLGAMTGGDNAQQQQRKIAGELADQKEMEIAAQKRALQLSADDVQLARLKLEGRDREAAALERQIALQKELGAIDRLQIDRSTKFQLSQDAIAKSALEGDAENKQFDEQNARAAQALIDSIDADLENAAKRRAKAKEDRQKRLDEDAKLLDEELEAIEKRREERAKNAAAQEAKRAQEVSQANDKLVAAEDAAQKIAETKLTLSEKLALSSKRIAEQEKVLAAQVQGTAGAYEAAAKLQELRNAQATLAAQKMAQFAGGTAAGQKARRDEEKAQREAKKTEERFIEEQVRRADRAARRDGNGLKEAEKDAIRARERAKLDPTKNKVADHTGEILNLLKKTADRLDHA